MFVESTWKVCSPKSKYFFLSMYFRSWVRTSSQNIFLYPRSYWSLLRVTTNGSSSGYSFNLERWSLLGFLVVPWLRIHLAMQGTLVRSLVQEGPRFQEEAKPCATATEAHEPRAHAPRQGKPPQQEAYTPQLERSPHSPQLEKSPHTATKAPCSQN